MLLRSLLGTKTSLRPGLDMEAEGLQDPSRVARTALKSHGPGIKHNLYFPLAVSIGLSR